MNIIHLLNPQGGRSPIGKSDREQGLRLLFVDPIQNTLTPENRI